MALMDDAFIVNGGELLELVSCGAFMAVTHTCMLACVLRVCYKCAANML